MNTKSASDITNALMRDVPRGISSRFLKDQTPPQARWMDPAQILKHPALTYDPKSPEGKILIGALGDKLIGINDDRHVLTVAGSRAGKSVTLIGNLMFYDGSVLCTDPKGELARVTAQTRRYLGQKVYVLDPFDVSGKETADMRGAYNPMRRLTLDNPYIIEDAAQIADGLVVDSGQEKDPHWNEEAQGLIAGLILYVAACNDTPADQKHLGTVRELLDKALSVAKTDDGQATFFALPGTVFAETAQLAKAGFSDIAAAIEGDIGGFYDKHENERAGVLSTARRHTRFLTYRAMKNVLTGHSFDLEDLKRDQSGVTIYLCLPATRMGMCNRWLRIMINQLIDAMEREDANPASPVLVALDEFPVLGFMRQLQDAAGQIASFGVKLWVIMQDWGQGKALYGDRFESFAANAGIFQAFGNVDVTTTEYISRRLGRTQIDVSRQGEADQKQREEGVSGRSVNMEMHDLLAPDEISRLFARSDAQKRQLVLWAGFNPMILTRVEYFDKDIPLNSWL